MVTLSRVPQLDHARLYESGILVIRGARPAILVPEPTRQREQSGISTRTSEVRKKATIGPVAMAKKALISSLAV